MLDDCRINLNQRPSKRFSEQSNARLLTENSQKKKIFKRV